MAKRSRSRSHTKRRKHRGGVWYNPMSWGQSDTAPAAAQKPVLEQIAPAATGPMLDAAQAAAPPVADAMTLPGVAPEAPGVTGSGGRRRRGSRKTKRRRGGKYY
jgi:hypothetical protein